MGALASRAPPCGRARKVEAGSGIPPETRALASSRPRVIPAASSNVWHTLALKNLMTCFTAACHRYLSILTEERHYSKRRFTPLSITVILKSAVVPNSMGKHRATVGMEITQLEVFKLESSAAIWKNRSQNYSSCYR